MKKEYDFSKGERGIFHNPDGELNLPIYRDREIADFMEKLLPDPHQEASDRNSGGDGSLDISLEVRP